jgi:predicted metal-dependent phosphoesterase TrpH
VFRLILDAGGIPVLAHPGVTCIDELIPGFIRDGLVGLEVYHSEHNSAAKKYYLEFCRKHDLVITGGSDFHSQTQTRAVIGFPRISNRILEKLKARCQLVHGDGRFI